MRLPHTVPHDAFEAYRCSEETQQLPGERHRTLRSEDVDWDDERKLPAELKVLALRVLAANWRERPFFNELPTNCDRDQLLELLPLDLPFELAVTHLPYEHYWQRRSEQRWRFNDPWEHGGSWLRLYCERHLSEYLERLDPAYFAAERRDCERLLRLLARHVHVLKLRQLVPFTTKISQPFGESDENIVMSSMMPRPPETHHIPMDLILQRLPNLSEIYINIGMIYMENDVTRIFEFSVEDSARIGRGSTSLEHLKKFSLTRSNLDQPRAAAILQGLAVNCSIEEIDFSHCKLGDTGAHAIGAYLSRGRVKVLRLTNNRIGPLGVAGIVHGLCLEDAPPPPLKRLDLRLNPLGDKGADHLSALLLRFSGLEYLNVSACSFGPDGGMGMAEVLASGRTSFPSLELDCSNNDFGEIVGEAFEIVAKACTAITTLDVRMCGFLKESEFSINESISRNRVQWKKRRSTGIGIERTSCSPSRIKSLKPPLKYAIFQRPREFVAPQFEATDSTISATTTSYVDDGEEGENEEDQSSRATGILALNSPPDE